MTQRVILFFLFILFLSCTSKKENSIELFNDITFKLIEGEEIKNIDNTQKYNFQSHFKNIGIQVPLFKCIKSKNYIIYLAIPLNTSVKELHELKLLELKNKILFSEIDTTTYFYISYYNNYNYYSEYTRNVENNLIYVLILSNSIKISDSLFNSKNLSKRFDK